MPVLAFFVLGAILTSSLPVSAAVLKIAIGKSGQLPYAEEAGGRMRDVYMDAVLGTWTRQVSKGNYVSDLITWEFSHDFRSILIKIATNAKFNNGRKIESSDFVFSLVRGLLTESRAFYLQFLSKIRGIEAQPSTDFREGSQISGIEVLNNKEIRISFREPAPEFLEIVNVPYFAPMPKEELRKDFLNWNHFPIGAGDFVQIAEDRAQGSYLVRAVKKPSFAIEFVTKRDSSVDIALAGAFESKYDNELVETIVSVEDSVWTLFTSNLHELGKIPNFLSLLSTSINRESIIGDASGTTSFVPSLEKFLDDRPSLDSRRQLRSLLAGRNTHVTAAISTVSHAMFGETRLNRLRQDFADMGMQLDFEIVDKKFLDGADARRFLFSIWPIVISHQAPLVTMASFRGTSRYVFHNRPEDKKLEELFLKGESAAGSMTANNRISELDSYIVEKGYGIPIVFDRPKIFSNPKRILSLGELVDPLSLYLPGITLAEPSLKKAKSCLDTIQN